MTEPAQQVIARLRKLAANMVAVDGYAPSVLQQAADLLAQQAASPETWRVSPVEQWRNEAEINRQAWLREQSRADSLASKVKGLEAELQRVKGQVHG